MKKLTLTKSQVIALYNNQKGISKEESILLNLAIWKVAKANNFHGWKASDLDATSINVENINSCRSYLDLLIF